MDPSLTLGYRIAYGQDLVPDVVRDLPQRRLENVGDFARVAAEHSTAGSQHDGVLIALSSRFSRRPAGVQLLIAAIRAVQHQPLADRVVYLGPAAAE